MLLRISLVIAIVAGLATLYFSHVNVAERLDTLTTERDTALGAQRSAEDQQRKAEKERRAAQEELVKANRDLADTVSSLEATTSRLAEQEKRANQVSEELTRVTGERNEAQTELAVWRQLNVTPQQIRNFRDQLAEVSEERDNFIAENKMLLRRNEELMVRLSRYEGDPIEPPMPVGLTGRVLAVDPRFDFVVLDVGGNQGVVPDGRLLVSRDGKLVGKLRVTKVEPDRSIANIMPDWRQAEVMEGDQVVY
jgi:cell shape-determining protein MreC